MEGTLLREQLSNNKNSVVAYGNLSVSGSIDNRKETRVKGFIDKKKNENE